MSSASKDLKFACDNCGEIEYVVIDGYSFSERTLEGVPFRVYASATKAGVKFRVEPDGMTWDDEYLRTLNRKHWEKEAVLHCTDNDVAECPRCKLDVDAQPVGASS